MSRTGPILCLLAVHWLITVTALAAAGEEFPIRPIAGLELTQAEVFEVKGARKPGAFAFNDGRICMMAGSGGGLWSDDAGKSWRDGPVGPLDKMAFDFGDGNVISIGRDTVPRKDGKFTVQVRRSSDNWKTVQAEEGVADVPLATSAGGDTAATVQGMLMHHGIVRLHNGELLATLYGNYKGDRIPFDAYASDEVRAFKYRTVVVRSSDRGKTWGEPRTVAYDMMLGARNEPDATGSKLTLVPAVTQEGFGEADLAVAPNGDIVCVMRSGGASGEGVVSIFPTPLYASRSSDDGKTWTSPVGIADRGVCPSLLTLENGIMVCVYSRPGFWLIFSDDNGKTWKGATQFESGKDYCYIVPTGRDGFLVFWERNAQAYGTRFTIRKR
jgi:hypothetical protein